MKPAIETRLTKGLRKHFVLLSFTLLHFTDNHVFYKLEICSNPFLNKSIGAIFLTLFAQFVSLYQVLIILTGFQFVYIMVIIFFLWWTVNRDFRCYHWNCSIMTSIMPMWDYKVNKCVCSDSGLPAPGDTAILNSGPQGTNSPQGLRR